MIHPPTLILSIVPNMRKNKEKELRLRSLPELTDK